MIKFPILEVEVGEDTCIRHDINNKQIVNIFPFLPKNNDWERHANFVKKRQRYLEVRDQLAFERCKFAFSRQKKVKVKVREKLICIFEEYVRKITSSFYT